MIHNASCHCGAVKFTVDLPDGLASARRCDCTFCTMRGAVALSTTLDGLKITEGAENLTLYQFGTNTARHHFCNVCGIYTHHQRRSNPQEFGVNMACLDGHTPFELTEIIVHDGQNHPNDGGPPDGVAGTLRYEANT